jgi:hypothetical protein
LLKSIRPNVVVHPQFPQLYLGVFDLLARNAASGGGLHSNGQFQALAASMDV